MSDKRASSIQSTGLLRFCALVGFLGALGLIGTILIAPLFVPDYNWIADTISDLGAGEHEIIVDIGLYTYAAALLCLSVGAAHMHPGGRGWSIGILTLLVLAALIIVVGARNEYGDNDNEGVVIHIYLVYGLGAGFAIAPFAMAQGPMRRVFYALGALWIITAPVFFFMPDGWDGLYERGLGLIALSWSSCLALMLWRAGDAR
ncbi:DUF998 domain-containing protein [Oceaniglobus ichthyenteri]|uniref:DUF998 domain-containing protein n=1 Tax=Oceaniglobus ichthyenteri TaxID=2136177 RepID=UPI000D34B2B7|nr:DUF998 domain-containing protein [Oceaniglobus ichthyenteri]